MNKVRSIASSAVAVVALVFAGGAHAAVVNVGGVVFDTEWTDGSGPPAVEQDFVSETGFTQWYTTAASGRGTLNWTGAQNINSVLGSLGGGSAATGFFLEGGGVISRINDPLAGIIPGTWGAIASFCPGCQLTYAFGGVGLNADASFNVTNAWVQVYVDQQAGGTLFNPPVNSALRAANLLDGLVWLDMDVATFELRIGSSVQAGFVDANLNIVGGLAENLFDPRSLQYSGSGFFDASPGGNNFYSNAGNGQLIGNTQIPEPGSLALVGIALLGLGAGRFVTRKARS